MTYRIYVVPLGTESMENAKKEEKSIKKRCPAPSRGVGHLHAKAWG
ncbi:MAG: hypothetical protein WCR42_05150 [bacterium]